MSVVQASAWFNYLDASKTKMGQFFAVLFLRFYGFLDSKKHTPKWLHKMQKSPI